jgi:hypothetical protein
MCVCVQPPRDAALAPVLKRVMQCSAVQYEICGASNVAVFQFRATALKIRQNSHIHPSQIMHSRPLP